MALERVQGAVVFFCDMRNRPECDGELATMETDFKRAFEVFEGCRWRAFSQRPYSGGFIHRCPHCRSPR